jgi:uncharacterized membrane protein YeiB
MTQSLPTATPTKRILTVDALRGFALLGIMIVHMIEQYLVLGANRGLGCQHQLWFGDSFVHPASSILQMVAKKIPVRAVGVVVAEWDATALGAFAAGSDDRN